MIWSLTPTISVSCPASVYTLPCSLTALFFHSRQDSPSCFLFSARRVSFTWSDSL